MESLLESVKKMSVAEESVPIDCKPKDDEIVDTLRKFRLYTTYLKQQAREQLKSMTTKFDEHWNTVKKDVKSEDLKEEERTLVLKQFVCYTDLVLSTFPGYEKIVKSIVQNFRSFCQKHSDDYHPICYMWMENPKSIIYTGAWRDRSVRYNSGCNEATDYILKIQFIINLCKVFGMKFSCDNVNELRQYWEGVRFDC